MIDYKIQNETIQIISFKKKMVLVKRILPYRMTMRVPLNPQHQVPMQSNDQWFTYDLSCLFT